MRSNGRALITVVGIGGAGVNAISRLMDLGLAGVRFLAVDTSAQTLARAPDAAQLPLVAGTRGLGTGGDARLGALAALGAERELRAALADQDLVFIVAGLAGGTGGGAAPEVARIARAQRAVTVGFAIMPFAFEARRRELAAERAQQALRATCNTTVLLENDRTLGLVGRDVSLDVALRVADDALRQAVQGLTELVGACGWINLDLAMLREMLTAGGEGCLALGVGRGTAAARAAMRAALASPLIDMGALGRAAAVLVQVSGGMDLSVAETAEAVALLRKRLAPDCDLVVGTALDPTLFGAAQVTLLGTGLNDRAVARPIPWPGHRTGLRQSHQHEVRHQHQLQHELQAEVVVPLAATYQESIRQVV